MSQYRAPMEPDPRFRGSVELFRRATSVIPGGLYGTKTPAFVIPGSYPYFFDRGNGCRLYDVDGNEFIDYMCGYGSMILGYGHEPVVQAGSKRLQNGDLLTSPAPVIIDLAERLVSRISGVDWAVFSKNGTDATTLAVTLARVETNKKVILMARGAYHGFANWASSNEYPILDDREHVVEFTYNDTGELTALFREHAGNIAAIILTPYHHRNFGASIMPGKDWYPTVHRLCEEEGALFIMDDIRANFRVHQEGSHVHFGAKPDFICMGKSIANGSPLGVLLGTQALKSTAASFFITGTFWFSGAPMDMAMACLDEMDRLKVLDHLNSMGKKLGEGLVSAANDSGFKVTMSGVPAIPFMTFDDDPDLFLQQAFCSRVTRRGIYFHPYHNWFISYAHKQADIQQTIDVAAEVFAELAAQR